MLVQSIWVIISDLGLIDPNIWQWFCYVSTIQPRLLRGAYGYVWELLNCKYMCECEFRSDVNNWEHIKKKTQLGLRSFRFTCIRPFRFILPNVLATLTYFRPPMFFLIIYFSHLDQFLPNDLIALDRLFMTYNSLFIWYLKMQTHTRTQIYRSSCWKAEWVGYQYYLFHMYVSTSMIAMDYFFLVKSMEALPRGCIWRQKKPHHSKQGVPHYCQAYKSHDHYYQWGRCSHDLITLRQNEVWSKWCEVCVRT